MCSLPGHPVCTRNQVCFIQTACYAKPSNNFNLNSFRRKRYDWAAVLQNPISRSLVLADEKYHLDEISNAYCQSEDLECAFVGIVDKSLFIYPKTKCFSASFRLLPSIFLPPVKWSTVICQKNAKYILIDKVEVKGGAHTTQGGGWKHERVAYPNWAERVKEVILVYLKRNGHKTKQ